MDHIEKAVEVLRSGGVIIFPTDTAFGIGCRIDDHDAIEKLFALRKRPLSQPTPVLVSSLDMAKRYGHFSESVLEKLIDPYWPGALTVIVPAKGPIDPLVVKNGGVGLRIPDNSISQKIIEEVGCAILGPSANFPGSPTPYNFEDLDQELVSLVDYVIPGETGGKAVASTVVSTLTTPWEIVREGAIKISL